jgi:hypothetical protein
MRDYRYKDLNALNKYWSEQWRKGPLFTIDNGKYTVRNLHIIKTEHGIGIKRPYTDRDLKRDLNMLETKLVYVLSRKVDGDILDTLITNETSKQHYKKINKPSKKQLNRFIK